MTVLVIGLNQTIDRTLRLPALHPGHVLRATDVAVTAGGKAVNVCRAAKTLGVPAVLVGPFPGRFGEHAIGLLAGEEIDVEPVAVAGELRGTTVIIEPERVTVINEPGPPLDAASWAGVLAAVEHATTGSTARYLAVSGSVPPGTPDDAHEQLTGLAHRHGRRIAVDIGGPRLVGAARGGADLVSPNLAEAEQALGTSHGHEAVDADADARAVEQRARAAAADLVGTGAAAAMVSAGRHGVAVRGAGADAFVPAPTVDVVNPVGAGDSLLGGTLVALERGAPLEAAVRHGVAYAAASVAHPVAGYADSDVVARLLRGLVPA